MKNEKPDSGFVYGEQRESDDKNLLSALANIKILVSICLFVDVLGYS